MANVLVIGSGVAGLTAGIYSQLSGHNTTICEAHIIPGGNLTGWQRGEYHIDNCIHWLTGTNPHYPTYKIWRDVDALGNVEIMQGDTLYTCEYKGETLSLYRDLAKLKEEMLKLSPKDEREINSFIRAVELVQGMCNIAGPNHDKGIGFGKLLFGFPILVKYYKMSNKELSECFTHPLIRLFISKIFGGEFGALSLIMVFATFTGDNGGIPRGSSLGMAHRMIERFKSLGGKLLTKMKAVKINHDGKRAHSVSFEDGSVIEADYIISTADPVVTFSELLDLPMPKALAAQYRDERLFRFSAYHCAFSCDLANLPFKADYLFTVPVKYRSILHTDHLTVREFSHEPSFAPEGKNILQTLTYCTEEDAQEFIKLRKTDIEAYRNKKKRIADTVIMLITTHFPELEGKLKCIDSWTPATYKRFVYSDMGSFMSFAMPKKSLPVRTETHIKGISNVLLATQWQQLPGGLPIAAERGKFAVDVINKIEKKKR